MRLVQLSRELSVRDVGRDKGSQGDTCRCREEQRHFADSTDVFFSVFRAESEVLPRLKACVSTREERIDQGVTHLVQTESDVIAVKSERMQLLVQKVLLQRRSDRGLRIHRQPGITRVGPQRRTFPLALRPVNQTVAPFWPTSWDRSSYETEPAGGWEESAGFAAWRESEMGSYLRGR